MYEYLQLKIILGNCLIYTGIFDAFKYHIEAVKMRKLKSAKGHSRRFINWAIQNDLVRLIYLTIYFDLYLWISTLLALGFMAEMWLTIYYLYPYKHRGLLNFRRPNIFLYIINSLLPNCLRKHL